MTEISMHQLTPQYVQRYTDTASDPHGGFSVGMIRDLPSWQLPPGACYDASDMLCDRPGKIRKRGGTTSPAAGNSTATVENLVSFLSGGADGVSGVFGSLGKGGLSIRSFNTSTGATTQLVTDGSVNTFACKPFQYQNLMVCPFSPTGVTANDRNAVYYCGGSTSTAAFTPSAATVVAGDNRVTGIATTGVVAGMLGSVIWLKDAATHMYAGRIVEITSSSAVRVDPTPTASFTANNGIVGSPAWSSVNAAALGVDPYVYSGRFGVTFQGRVVLGYTTKSQGVASGDLVKGVERKPNQIVWTQLASEPIPTAGLSGYNLDGLAILYPQAFPIYNFLDTPDLGGMTGLAVAGDGQLMIFGPNKTFRVSGFLSTETVANPVFSFSDDQISQNVGCSSAKGIQYTPIGLVFPWIDNLYVFDGSSMRPLLRGTNAKYYQDRLRTGDTILGSAWAGSRSHYYLSMSGTDGGLMVDFENFATTRITNVQLFDSCPDPVNSSTLWGARWWDTTSAAPTMTKGQLIQIDPLWVPTSANKTDADGTAVLSTFQSPAYVEGLLSHLKNTTRIRVTYDLRGSGSPTATVSADTKLNVADAVYASLATAGGTLADTTAAADTGFAHIDSGPLLDEGQALEVKIAMNASANIFEILQIELGTQSHEKLL